MSKGKEMTNNKILALNLVSSFITYAITFGISFFLSPFIVETVGVEAYGFVGLANNFISYASLITIALNALAGRFITIKLRENDISSANKYYTSVFYGNLFLSAVLFIAALFVWIFLEKIINIPDSIFWDVKILFAALFMNCIISTSTSVFGIATFATNKLYLSSVRNIEASLIRTIILVVLFLCFSPNVYYLGITSLLVGIYSVVYNIYYTKKLTPELQLKRQYFDKKAVWELVSSGVWNLITRLGQILCDGVDLLITNLLVDPTSMGVLSLAKTVPGIIQSIIGTMVNSFSPNFTILYAEGKINELKDALKQSMKIMGVISNVPIIILIVCGQKFFECWQPTQDAKALQILSILTCAGFIINGGINCIYDIFTVVNKLKYNSIVLLISSAISICVTFILLKTTDLGVYAVAGVSTVIMIAKNVVLIVPYAAKCLDLKKTIFYPEIIRSIIFVAVSTVLGYFVNNAISFDGWFGFFFNAIIIGLMSLIIGTFVMLNKSDRQLLISKIRRKK